MISIEGQGQSVLRNPEDITTEFPIDSWSDLSDFIEVYDKRVDALKAREGGTYREAVANTAGIIIPNIDLLLLNEKEDFLNEANLEKITDLKTKKKELKLLINDAVTNANKPNPSLPPPPREISDEEVLSIKAKVDEIKELVKSLTTLEVLID